MAKQEMISGPFQGTLFTVITLNPESNCTCRERSVIPNSTEIYRRDQGYGYVTGCNAGEEYRRSLECWWGPRLARNLDRFHQVHYIGWKTTGWTSMVQGETDKKEKRPPDLTLCGQRFGKVCRKRRNVKKIKSGLSRNQSSTIPEDCVVFTSLIQSMKISRIFRRMRVESWKFRWQQECLVKLHCAEVAGKPARYWRTQDKNTLLLLKLTNLREPEWKELFADILKIILQEKEWIHWVTTILCTKIYSYASSNENTWSISSSG